MPALLPPPCFPLSYSVLLTCLNEPNWLFISFPLHWKVMQPEFFSWQIDISFQTSCKHLMKIVCFTLIWFEALWRNYTRISIFTHKRQLIYKTKWSSGQLVMTQQSLVMTANLRKSSCSLFKIFGPSPCI